MREAVAQREAMTPIFLAELDRMANRPQDLLKRRRESFRQASTCRKMTRSS
jgi:hypothetical protein